MNKENKGVKRNGLAFWCQEGMFRHFIKGRWKYKKSSLKGWQKVIFPLPFPSLLVTGRTLSDQTGSFSLVPKIELHAL